AVRGEGSGPAEAVRGGQALPRGMGNNSVGAATDPRPDGFSQTASRYTSSAQQGRRPEQILSLCDRVPASLNLSLGSLRGCGGRRLEAQAWEATARVHGGQPGGPAEEGAERLRARRT